MRLNCAAFAAFGLEPVAKKLGVAAVCLEASWTDMTPGSGNLQGSIELSIPVPVLLLRVHECRCEIVLSLKTDKTKQRKQFLFGE